MQEARPSYTDTAAVADVGTSGVSVWVQLRCPQAEQVKHEAKLRLALRTA